MVMRVGTMGRWAAAGLLLLAASTAGAGISPVIFRIDVSNAGGSAYYEATSGDLVPDPGIGGYRWVLPAYQDLDSGGNLIAVLNAATLRVVDNPAGFPRVILNFDLLAGAQDLDVTVKSALVSFSPLPAALAAGRASVGFTLTDYVDGVPAQIAGPGGMGMFTAQYNGFVPGGTTFANLIPLVTAGVGSSTSVNDAVPPASFALIGQAVSDISVMYEFSMTAMDLMSGQSTYVVTPEPAGLALFGMAGLALALRRR